MLVSQYIYTACGKERTGAFSVFSKSSDISDSESTEIREVMMYKTPSGLPYEPSEQEIEELYPKKFGYFFLSSGRACLAQVCYVGRVYSDLDNRFGNYIIHAFIFEKNDDFSPYSFIEHELFKRKLSKKEWHDDPIPDELPQIEIPLNGGMLTTNELTSFFDDDHKNKLKLLLNATIFSSMDNPLCFNDDNKNLRYWLKMLSVCLPKKVQNSISICSYFTNTLTPGSISLHLQIRINQPESYQFNYAQELQKGHFSYDFLRNIFPTSLKVNKYSENILILFSSGIFEVVKFVDYINTVMTEHSVNINEAFDVISLYKENYSNFENINEIFNTIIIADRAGFETQLIAKNLWMKKQQFNFNKQQSIFLYSFIYKNYYDINLRIKIIKEILINAKQLGISTDNAYSFRKDLVLKVNFIFENYSDYIKADGLTNYIKNNKDSFLIVFLAFDFLTSLKIINNNCNIIDSNASEEFKALKEIMYLTFKQQSITNIDLLIDTANSHSNGLGNNLLYIIINDVIDSKSFITNIHFAFEILERLRKNTDLAFKYLLDLVKNFSSQNEFIKAYLSDQINEADFYTRFEKENSHDPTLKDFSKKKDFFRFANLPLTLKILYEFHEKYYVNGEDTGLFVKRLKEFLCAIPHEKRINECFSIMDSMKLSMNNDNNLIQPLNCAFIEAIFSVPYKKIYDIRENDELLEKINTLFTSINNSGFNLTQEPRELILITLCDRILKKYAFQKNMQIYSFFGNTHSDANSLALNLEKINSTKSINIFVEFYFQSVANILIVGAMGSKQFNYNDVIEKVFGNIIEKGDLEKITDIINHEIKKAKVNSIFFILFIFRKYFNRSTKPLDQKFSHIAEKYFEKLQPNERKKTFSELLAMAESKTEIEQFELYFEEFNKSHKGGLFSFFKK